jgi:lipoate-protein ligase B
MCVSMTGFDELLERVCAYRGEGDSLLAVGLGRIAYDSALALQERLRDARVAGRVSDTLLLLEHPAVYTLGRRGDAADLRTAAGSGVAVRRVDRGGAVTFHGPGQLVGYPIIGLRDRQTEVRSYMWSLEEAIIRTVGGWGVQGERLPGAPGVWVGGRKLASVGVRVRDWVTTHGLALNVTTDLEYFAAIVPCGMPGVQMTSLMRERVPVSVEDAGRALADALCVVLGYERLRWIDGALAGTHVGGAAGSASLPAA